MVIAPMSLNEFLPASTAPMARRAEGADEELDMAKFSAIRKEQKDELERLDQYHQSKQAEIEGQVREQLDRLFQQFQQGMQSLYTSLTQTAHATVETQVKLRMQQEKLREEHASNKRDIERRYHNEASRLFMSSSSEPTHHPHSIPKVNSNPTRISSAVPSNNGDHLLSPATSSAVITPPIRQHVVPSQLPTDAIKEANVQEASGREYVAPYPTPLEPAPRQRPLGPADARPLESRPLEPRPLEPRPVERRFSEQRPVEPSPARPRPMHAAATRHVYEDTHIVDTQRLPQPRPVPSHQLHHQGRQDVAVPETAHTRPDAKRKIVEFSAGAAAHDEANFKHYAKRPRTQEVPPADVPNGSQAPPAAKQSPRINQPAQIAMQRHADRTVTFDEIYQNGKAQYKHKIFEWKVGSGNWYIVRCDDHQVHFGFKNPIHGAAKHMHSPQHGNLEKRHDLAIEICGHRVLGCNADLAEINNREFERALREDRYRVFNRNLLTKDGRRRLCGDQSPVLKKEPLPTPPKAMNQVQLLPQEGKFYQGLWAPNKKWYMLIVLPIRPDGSLREVGLREKLQETQLMSNVPKCYRVDRVSLLIKGFQPAYEDGGPKVDKREYPVMFFDGHQRHSLGWLPAQKLREVDLDNPPESVDKRGLSIARQWYSQHMMHRRDWEEFKKLGPGEPSSAAFEEDSGQWPSLRSAHTDNQSPIQDRPGHFGFGIGSASGSDDEDTMMVDSVPTSRSQDTSRATQSPSEVSDKEMPDARPHGTKDDERPASHLSRREAVLDQTKSKTTSRPSSQQGPLSEMRPGKEAGSTTTSKCAAGKDEKTIHQGRAPQNSDSAQKQSIEHKATSDGPQAAAKDGPSSVFSEQEVVRRNAQVKAAAAAVMEAASRSRASSEVPDSASKDKAAQQQVNGHGPTTQLTQPPRPALSEHQRSKSDDLPRSEAELSRKPSDLHSILNAEHKSSQQESGSKERVALDPYKQFEAIKAQMALDGLNNRPVSAPASADNETASAFIPPARASHSVAALDVDAAKQHSPSTSHNAETRSQRPESNIRSPSTASVQGADSDAESDAYWNRYGHINKHYHKTTPSAAPCNSDVERAEVQEAQSSTAKELPTPTAQLGTPIAADTENFEVTYFSDTGRGLRWTRDKVTEPLLRLKVDEMRGWAETPSGSPLKAAVEPLKVSRIEVDTPTTGKNSSGQNKLVLQHVHLTLKNGHKQTLVFETQLQQQQQQQHNRWATATGPCLQGRQFAAWVKKWNREAEYRQESSV